MNLCTTVYFIYYSNYDFNVYFSVVFAPKSNAIIFKLYTSNLVYEYFFLLKKNFVLNFFAQILLRNLKFSKRTLVHLVQFSNYGTAEDFDGIYLILL